MKEQSRKRGLYQRVIQTPETESESFDNLRALADSLADYLADAEDVAGAILREADIDPDSLFEVIEKADGFIVQHATIDRKDLPVEIDQALDVMLHCHTARIALQDAATKSGLQHGILLAQAVDSLNANLAWRKPVEGRRKQMMNLRHDQKVTDDQINNAIAEHGTQEKAAEALGLSVRQLRRRIAELKK